MSDEAAFLAAIAAEPDAIEPRLVYADWLQARNDPRGELIVVQAGRLAKPGDVQLEVREKELTTALTNALIGAPLSTDLIVRWHLGFVDALKLVPRVIRLLRTSHRAWFAQPAFAAVRELDIDSKYARSLRFIRHLGLASTVTRLRFGDHSQLEEPALEAIVARVPKLTALTLRTRQVPPLGALRTVRLRELSLDLYDLTDEGFQRIVEVPWALDTFGLKSTSLVEDRLPLLAQFYNGTTLASVKHFVIGGDLPTIAVLETLATSKRATTLDSFTADYNRATQDQLLRIEPHREALAKVKLLPVLGQGPYYDVENYSKLGSLLNFRLDRPAEALAYYEQGLRVRPEDSTLRYNLGVALRKLRRLDESLIAFDTLINTSKNPTASMFNGRHYTLCELGRRSDARADLERALEIDPNFADAWNNIGVERQYTGDAEGALAAFRRCMELDPEHRHALSNEAELLLEVGRAGDAVTIYARLLAAKPSDSWLLGMLAHAQVEVGAAAAARATLDDPAQTRHPRLHVLRALALRDLGEHAAAHADLDECARTTDCPGWFAMTVYVRSLDERSRWTRMIPDSAIAPRELADAVLAVAKAVRPVDATVLHDATLDDQMDCSELAIAAALLARDRDLAVQRARAVAALYAEQGPRYFRRWWQSLATVVAVTNRELDEESRALLSLVLRAVRGRTRIADVMALVA